MKAYCSKETGKIIDIGCGQSTYLLDFLDSKFDLYGVDIDQLQLNYLEQRINAANHNKERVNLSSEEFPTKDFVDIGAFDVIILSNLLHFYTKPEAKRFISDVLRFSSSGTYILVTVHTKDHYLANNKITSDSFLNHKKFRMII
ncbi:MAG: class I SAM-dependent methyltransferase [Saprospiraceae bacterium]|nr:class I SAM-dependent methyltransferase [Saprospiraceae bacterium]